MPNILKVLNPLFLDELRETLAEAGDSVRKLRALRRRIGRIRVFDPACGSGNFLVIAYRHMREIEHEIVQRTGDDPKSVIPLTNFYGIEIKGFAAEIARLALLIAEFQADSRLISQQAARSMVLPLHRSGQIHTGNALRMNWLEVCPPAAPVREEWDLGGPTGRLALEENGLGGAGEVETYVCGNPPYYGSVRQDETQKADLKSLFPPTSQSWKSLDYVAGWFIKAARYAQVSLCCNAAFVATKSICQGEQVPLLWREVYASSCDILFARAPFDWSNLASNNAGVTVVIVGIGSENIGNPRIIYSENSLGESFSRQTAITSPYLIPGTRIFVVPASSPPDPRGKMIRGNLPNDGGFLIFTSGEAETLWNEFPASRTFTRPLLGSADFINGSQCYCLWISDRSLSDALQIPPIKKRIDAVRKARTESTGSQANSAIGSPHRFVFSPHQDGAALVIPRVSSVSRPYLPVGVVNGSTIISDRAIVIYGGSLVDLAVLASKIHLAWIATVCVRMRMDYSYSNTLGWNTFPLPRFTDRDKADLTRCAEDILLAREAHFPATIADMYDPERMDRDFPDLRAAHERNDETLERIYIGRRFRNDTERLEHLFALYAKMTASDAPAGDKGAKKPRAKRSKEAA